MENLFTPPKFAKGTLIGVDSNAFGIMGYFQRVAKRSGWSDKEIDIVIEKATESDYYDLIATINTHLKEDLDE